MIDTSVKSYILLKNDHYELLPCDEVEFTVQQMKNAINAEILDFPPFRDPMGFIKDKYTAEHLRGVVDDSGALNGKEENTLASLLYDPWHSVIYGDVLLCFDVNFEDGDTELCPIPVLFLKSICDRLDDLILHEIRYDRDPIS